MIRLERTSLLSKATLSVVALSCLFTQVFAQNNQSEVPLSCRIKGVQQINPTTVQLIFTDNQRLTIDFYGKNIFRVFEDTAGGVIRQPEAVPPANILVRNARRAVGKITVTDNADQVTIASEKISIEINKNTSLFKVVNLATRKIALETLKPIEFDNEKVTLVLKENPDEYFYGGGVQNGRFSHKGTSISIENQNSWTDGGVASPAPFYCSTKGYGFLWNTFKQGKYNLGAKEKGEVILSHNTNYLDVFFMISDSAANLLQDFYQLTGNPVLLPKFAFYEGHLNAYNRDYWKEDTAGILFEDGKRYKESQKNNGGIKESLNGEKNNYQFSARAVIDRYKQYNMPLGWILPNDGYGAGYGQTSTLDSNIANLKSFGDYARKHGVQIGLWTQSDLHPKPGVSALLQRDIVKEVRDAGVHVLKTDVAWVGEGYSFGLHGVSDVAHIVPYYGDDARPFIITLDGWAGTQRYATVWSGDQTGGNWEYIRFHIPTFIGAGLSGQPNITSDMDGIFGGKNPIVNAREFEWKTFTPMQLNMDGWGANPKYPEAMGEPVTSINRTYLKLKSELLPYTYSVAREAITGLPIIRAMFLEEPNAYTLGKATKYQFMYGPYLLIAPIYQATEMDKEGNDIRNNIYLPKGKWIDYFTGQEYTGDCIINSFNTPIWKLPVFVKRGAIIPMNNPNNHISEIDKSLRTYEIYPFGHSAFTQYNDDGITEAYKNGKAAITLIESTLAKGIATITVHPTSGNFNGFVKQKTTDFKINVSAKPQKVLVYVDGKKQKMAEANTIKKFNKSSHVYFYNVAPDLNRFATPGSPFAKVKMIKNPQIWIKIPPVDVTSSEIKVKIEGFQFNPADKLKQHGGSLDMPAHVAVLDSDKTAYSLKLTWNVVPNADFYEIVFDSVRYTTIRSTHFLFKGLQPETSYSFKISAVNKDGQSDWAALQAKTKVNPLELAIPQIVASSSVADQEGDEISNLFDFDEKDMWHTKWDQKAVPFDVVMDLKTVNQLDKLEYLPRVSGRNGIITKGVIYYSIDKHTWNPAGEVNWNRNNTAKTFNFTGHPSARYIKLSVEAGVNDFGSGRELYVFKTPGTESYLQGDINNDHKIDRNDLTSYANYMGLKKGDADFEGYISKGDINKNGMIDAYDISAVATQLDGGVETGDSAAKVSGYLEISTAKKSYHKNEIIELTVKGINLSNINALSFALPYDPEKYEYAGVLSLNTGDMENLTYDRLHSDGSKVLYPVYINIGNKTTINGSKTLFIIKFKAKRNLTFNLKPANGILTDKNMNYISDRFNAR